MFRFFREVWIQHGLLWGDPLIGVHHKEPGQLGSEEKGEDLNVESNADEMKNGRQPSWSTIILKIQWLALWQSLVATGSIQTSSSAIYLQ